MRGEERVLHIVCKHANADTAGEHGSIVQYLIRKGAKLEVKDNTGNTPLHDLVDQAAMDESSDK